MWVGQPPPRSPKGVGVWVGVRRGPTHTLTGRLQVIDSAIETGYKLVPSSALHLLALMPTMFRSLSKLIGPYLDELPGGVSLEDAEERLMDYLLTHLPEPKTAPLAGNTIGTDRAFLQQYMPRVHEHLHYRNIDVSTIKELARQWYPKMYFQSPEKNGGHRAPADILESIRELAYYRQVAFVPTPGPSTTEIKKISDAVTEQFGSRQLGD